MMKRAANGTGVLAWASMHVNKNNAVENRLLTGRTTCKKFLWLYLREKMIHWLALGLFKQVFLVNLCTCTSTQQKHTTSLLHFTEQGRPELWDSAVLLSERCCFHSLPLSLSSSKWKNKSVCPPFLQKGGLVLQTRRMLAYCLMLF